MKKTFRRGISLFLLLAMLISLAPAVLVTPAEARNYGVYKDVAKIPDKGSCPSMQGMSVHGNYVYSCKINGNTDASAVVARVPRAGGTVTYLTNAATGTNFFSDFGHGNDIEVETIAGVTTLFVPTSKSGSNSLVRYAINGTTATKVGNYTMTNGTSNLSGGAIRVIHYDDTNITFLFKSGSTCYTGTLPITQTSGTLKMTQLCKLDYSGCYVNGTYKDTSAYSLQGMGYYDYKLYLPLSGHTVSTDKNISIILVYDLEGASGTIKPDPDLTFCITSGAYSALFELESCEISPLDNRMYFSANRRVSDSDTNHDGVSYISNWTYDPSARTSQAGNYRWETVNDQLISVTDGGNTYNGVHQLEGKIVNGTYTDSRFTLSKNMVLWHTRPWVVEWKSSGAGFGSLLFATQRQSAYTDQPYVFRNAAGNLIALGAHDGSQYNNYGVDISKYGIDPAAEHVYRLTNRLASDGTNMVYLSVDGRELGPMNNHFVASSNQGTTSSWVSGKDFRFSYLGTMSHPIGKMDLEYIQVWGEGPESMSDVPNTYRWENGMTSVTTYGLTPNATTLVSGTTSGSTYTDCRYDLTNSVVLMHDRPWVVEWEDMGNLNTIMMAADHRSNTRYAPYLYRNTTIISMGYHNGTNHQQWGVKPADYGVSLDEQHTFALKNIIAGDGTNMIYLYADGKEVAPMTTVCTSGSATSETSDYLSGKDFVFSHLGTYQHDITGGMGYLQVWEAGKPEEDEASSFFWETREDTLVNYSDDRFTSNQATMLGGSCTDGVFNSARWALEKTVVLRHDRFWQIKWLGEGTWETGVLMLSSDKTSYVVNNTYLFRDSNIISFGTYNGSRYEQWGIRPADYGVNINERHEYTLKNRVNADGSNMVYLYVDRQEVGPLNTLCINGIPGTETTNELSGKDFLFSYIGTDPHSVSAATVDFLEIYEDCPHHYHDWQEVTPAACTTPGMEQRVCTDCGDVLTREIPATGHSYSTQVTAPSCTQEGYTTYTCTACGDSYVADKVEADGHSYDPMVTPPTCTQGGHTTYTCTTCGDSYTGSYQDPTGHSYEGVSTAPTCTEAGFTTYTCSCCGHSYEDQITDPLGHSYTTQVTAPSCTEAGYTTYTCTTCGDSYVADEVVASGHSFVEGICTVCCAQDPDYVPPVIQPTLKLSHPSLTFEDVITMNVYFSATDIQDVVEMGLITYTSQVTEWNVDNAEAVIPGYQLNANGLYSVVSNGIAAKDMGDTIWFAVYAKTVDGNCTYTKLVSYSPKTYAYSMLTKGTEATQKLCVALLNYGAAAQVYFNYNTDTLMNADLTTEQVASIESYRSDMMTASVAPDAAKAANFVNNGGYTRRYPSIVFEGAFAISYNFIPSATPVGDITMYVWDQATFDSVEILTRENATKAIAMTPGSTYVGVVDGIAAKDLDKGVYVTFVYSDGTTEYCSGILNYSIGDYCTGKAAGTTTMAPFAAATAVYGYYAKEMFYYTDNG